MRSATASGAGSVQPAAIRCPPPPKACPSRPPIPIGVRAYVLARDGWKCVTCGCPDDLTIDHVWPWSKGGTSEAGNLQTLCRPCNSSKGARV